MNRILNLSTKMCVGSFLGELTSYLFGGWDAALRGFLLFMALDYITGICKALYFKKLNSQIGAKGVIKKVGYLCVIAVAFEVSKIIGDVTPIRLITIYFFIGVEAISILENWALMGLPIPKFLFERLEQLKGKVESLNGNDN